MAAESLAGAVDPNELSTSIVDDVFEHHRGFLPGIPCVRSDVYKHLRSSIRLDGLSSEEALLILSIMPRNAVQIWLQEMDKGLSGSKVFKTRYSDDGGRFSKQFVVKVGDISKIDREADAVERLCAPYLPGIEFPVRRRGIRLGLIAQELRGLSVHAEVESLRFWIRENTGGGEMISRLLRERLWPWYEHAYEVPLAPVQARRLFEPYISKISSAEIFPENWSDLRRWVEGVSGIRWNEPLERVASLGAEIVAVPLSISHGDLHSQNILVDASSRECWPIDFAWCRDDSSLVVDLVMLECSLKYLAFPMRAELREILGIDWQLMNSYREVRVSRNMPYGNEVRNALEGVFEIRRFAEELNISFEDYRRCLCLMTFAHSTHPGLNRPLVLGATQMLLGGNW